MASLPPIRKLYDNDYPSQKDWIQPFLLVMNQFINSVVTALTAQLTIVENTTSDIKTVLLSSAPSASSPFSFAWKKTANRCQAILVGNIRAVSGTLTLSSAVQVQWQMSSSGTEIQITNIVGVTPSQTNKIYLTLICIAG